MKLLFTSIGRRVELIQAFKSAAERSMVDLYIVGGDVSNTAPALHFCDEAVTLPLIKSNDYIPFLIDYCNKNHIDALIPTIDTDLLPLAEHKEDFGHTKVIVSSPEMIRICRDKRLTADSFAGLGLNCPAPVDDIKKYAGPFPAFIKPRDGSSSINAFKATNMDELLVLAKVVPDYIIQPFVGGIEYTIDVFCDFKGDPIYITPRIRLEVRSGEVSKTKIAQDQTIIDETKKIISAFKPCGAVTIQMIRDSETGKDFYIEINPRYGGGAPLSIKAGADSARAMIELLLGHEVNYTDRAAEDNATYCRYDQSVRVE